MKCDNAKTAGVFACDIDAGSLCDVNEVCDDERLFAAESSAIQCEHDEAFERLIRRFDPEEFSKNEDDHKSTGEESEEEAVRARVIHAPSRPSAAEVEEHMATHVPFRAWCPHCVRGKARGKKHARAKEGQREMPTFAIDYT